MINHSIDAHPAGQHPDDTFQRRFIPALNRSVFRLGLAGAYGLDQRGWAEALSSTPVEYLFWTPRIKDATPSIRDAFKKDRARFVLASGPPICYTRGALRKGVDTIRKQLDTDYIDVLHLFWLGKTSFWRPAIVEELVKMREEGIARTIAVSVHDRKRAAELAKDSPLDLLMLRYNAAHPGAEKEVFPHLHHRRPGVISYTATAWGKLLSKPSKWSGPNYEARDCYRFALSNPHVDATLCGPASMEQFRHNLSGLEQGPMTAEEIQTMVEFGKTVRDSKVAMKIFQSV